MTVAYRPNYTTEHLPTIIEKAGALPYATPAGRITQVIDIPEVQQLRKGPLPHLAEFVRSLPYLFLTVSSRTQRRRLIREIFKELTRRDYPADQLLQLFWQLDVRLEPGDFLPALLDCSDRLLKQGPLSPEWVDWAGGLLEQGNENSAETDDLRFRLWRHRRKVEQDRKTPSLDLIRLTGFVLPAASRRHDYATGLHPDQLRPFLQVLKAVAPVQGIDFPAVAGQTALRYAHAGEVRTCPTLAGDLLLFVATLNEQLYALNIPYQFIFLCKASKRKTLVPDPAAPSPVLTLMNSGTYRQYRPDLPQQAAPRFARSRKGKAEPFTDHLQALPNLRMNPGLTEQIDASGTLFAAD
jgi:hypothetical protein